MWFNVYKPHPIVVLQSISASNSRQTLFRKEPIDLPTSTIKKQWRLTQYLVMPPMRQHSSKAYRAKGKIVECYPLKRTCGNHRIRRLIVLFPQGVIASIVSIQYTISPKNCP